MSGIPYNELQSIECTAKDENGNDHTIATFHYAFVIPCRDCRYYKKDPNPIDPGWSMVCEDSGRDMLEPDGFCAWGERRSDR